MTRRLRRKPGHKEAQKTMPDGFMWSGTGDGAIGVRLWHGTDDQVYIVASSDGTARPLCMDNPLRVCFFIAEDDARLAALANDGLVYATPYSAAVNAAEAAKMGIVLCFPDGTTADMIYNAALDDILDGAEDDDIPF